MKTKIKKAIALTSILGILLANSVNVFAEKIGEINVGINNGNISPSTENIDKNGTTASGSLGGIIVRATVAPILNLKLSDTLINLEDISAEKSGYITLEAGTNAPAGVVITVTSLNGGLKNTNTGITVDNLINSSKGGKYAFKSESGSSENDYSGNAPTRDFLSETEIANTNALTIYNGKSPEKSSTDINDVKFTVTAKAQENAVPGTYEDYLTFNITATF